MQAQSFGMLHGSKSSERNVKYPIFYFQSLLLGRGFRYFSCRIDCLYRCPEITRIAVTVMSDVRQASRTTRDVILCDMKTAREEHAESSREKGSQTGSGTQTQYN